MAPPDLTLLFAALPLPGGPKVQFSAVPIPGCGDHKIAKDVQGNACLLICTAPTAGNTPPPVRLQNLTVDHTLRARVWTETSSDEGLFSAMTLDSSNPALLSVFLRLAPSVAAELAGKPTPETVARALRRFVEVFQALKHPAQDVVQGLWSELAVIDLAEAPSAMVAAWHGTPTERYDFSAGKVRLEVKSTSGRSRRHHFSLEQLSPAPGCLLWIASLFAERASGGRSVADLLASIRGKLSEPTLSFRLEELALAVLGETWEEGLKASFDYELAADSLRFIRSQDVPRPVDVPLEVSGVSFWSDLSGVKSVNRRTGKLIELGGWF